MISNYRSRLGKAETAGDSRAQKNTGWHKDKGDDDMDGKFLFIRNDMEEQGTGPLGRYCKIRLRLDQTT